MNKPSKKLIIYYSVLFLLIPIVIYGITFSVDELKSLLDEQQEFGGTKIFPYAGGTGTSDIPTYGQILMGSGSGVYQVTSTPHFSNLLFTSATVTDYLMVGAGTVDYLNFQGGDLYVQNDVEIDGSATTTGALYVTKDLTVLGDTLLQTTFFATGTTQLATTTVQGDFTVEDINGTDRFSISNNTGNATTTGNFTAQSTLYVKDGNVGIGTTGPASKLNIYSATPELRLEGSGTNSGWLSFYGTGGRAGYIQYLSTPAQITFDAAGATNGFGFISGNVGIGTTGPGGKLHVSGDGTATQLLVQRTSASQSNGIGLADQAGTTRAQLRLEGVNNNDLQFLTVADTNIRFYTNSDGAAGNSATNERMRITNTGNVGIGTTTPSGALVVMNGNVGIGIAAPTSTLSVLGSFNAGGNATVTGQLVVGLPTGGGQGAGTINAQAVYDDSVILTDYVFEDGYQLMSIPEMTKFYQTNYHLPTIISRKEFETKRPSTGELLNQLWETVEVQAKYISELEIRITALEKEKNEIKEINWFNYLGWLGLIFTWMFMGILFFKKK